MMRELNSWQNAVFRLGALLILVGVMLNIFNRELSLWVYSAGMIAFCLMQIRAEYLGTDITVKRLRRQQLMACLFFFLTSVCMGMQTYHLGMAQRNEWVVMLSVACVLELYTAWRLPSALSKAKKS